MRLRIDDDSHWPSRRPSLGVGRTGVHSQNTDHGASVHGHYDRDCAPGDNRLPPGRLWLDATRHVNVVFCGPWHYSLRTASAAFSFNVGVAETSLFVIPDRRLNDPSGPHQTFARRVDRYRRLATRAGAFRRKDR